MLAGPRLQDELAIILSRWRIHKYVVTADVEKMFRQIMVSKDHQKYQCVFWRDKPTDPLGVYQLTRVAYGTTSAPYLAIRTLQQLAKDELSKFPKASAVPLTDFYVDDILTGSDTMESCKELKRELQAMMKCGGFCLRKWSSNCSEILQDISNEDISHQMLNLQVIDQQFINTLGLIWVPNKDCFTFKICPLDFNSVKKTKTTLSSDVSKMFDPLGWLAPITIGR